MAYITDITTKSQLDSLLSAKKGKLVIIDFHATWCGPCHVIAPKYQALSERYRDATFTKCDTDKCQDVAQEYSIRAMPTFVFIKNGSKVGEVKGANAAGIEAEIRKHTSADAGSAPTFPGSGHTLSGAPAPSTGTNGSGIQRMVVFALLVGIWYYYSNKSGQVLGV